MLAFGHAGITRGAATLLAGMLENTSFFRVAGGRRQGLPWTIPCLFQTVPGRGLSPWEAG